MPGLLTFIWVLTGNRDHYHNKISFEPQWYMAL